MTIALSQSDRQYLERFVNRKARPTSQQKAQALLSLAAGELPERVAQLVGLKQDQLVARVVQFNAEDLKGSAWAPPKRADLAGPGLAHPVWSVREAVYLAVPDPRFRDGSRRPSESGEVRRIAGTRIPVWQLVGLATWGFPGPSFSSITRV